MRLYRAEFVAPMEPGREDRVIPDGGVLCEGGRVVEVGPAIELAKRADEEVDFGRAVLLPGLVNAHAHLELSDARPGGRPESLGKWLTSVVRQRHGLGDKVEQAAAEAARRGAVECLRFGVTCVGDVSRFCRAVRPVLAESPLRAVSFGEVQAMAGRRHLLEERFDAATDGRWHGWADRNRLLIAATPHAPYTVEPAGYRRCLDWAVRHDRPLCTHLAETTEEAVFLADHAGPLRELWDALREWTDDVPKHAGGPIRLAKELGLLDAAVPVVLAHVNHADADEIALLAGGTASAAYCPRTHAWFGHPRHPMEELLAAGVNVCVGTDSRASSPDLNLADDLRLIRRDRPKLPASLLWGMATWRAAKALGVDGDVGTLSPGRFADLVAFPLDSTTDPLAAALDEDAPPAATVVEGEVI